MEVTRVVVDAGVGSNGQVRLKCTERLVGSELERGRQGAEGRTLRLELTLEF